MQEMKISMATVALLLTITVLLFSAGDCDVCHRKHGMCKAPGATCLGSSRANECRYPSYRCCHQPMRGKRRKKRHVDSGLVKEQDTHAKQLYTKLTSN